ncbi:putative reverse transcriptase domain-containing protein [Tanacetum coccineum]
MQTMEESLRKFMAKSAKRHDENSNLIKEIRASMDYAIRNQGASIKTLKIQIGQMSKVLQDKGSGSLPGLTETNSRDHVNSISTTVEADMPSIRSDLGASVSVMPLTTFTNLGLGELAPTKLTIELADRTIKHPKGIAENILVGIGKFVFPIDFIILDMPEDVKVPLILRRPFLSTAHAKIDMIKRKITLRVGNDKITFKRVKPASSLIKRVYVLGLIERMDLDLEARLMGEALILNRLLDPEFGDFIELNDLNEPLELRRNQMNDLGPTREEGEIIDEPMKNIVKTRNDNEKNKGINEYPSIYDYDRKIHVDYAYNLQFSFVENMDVYRNEEIGDVIIGEPFCRALCVKARSQYDVSRFKDTAYRLPVSF